MRRDGEGDAAMTIYNGQGMEWLKDAWKSFGMMVIGVLWGMVSMPLKRPNHLKTRHYRRGGNEWVNIYRESRSHSIGGKKRNHGPYAPKYMGQKCESGGHAHIPTMTFDLNIYLKATSKTTSNFLKYKF